MRAWFNLIPDTNHTILTSGYGTYATTGRVSVNTYATAARTIDGPPHRYGVLPTRRTFTINMRRFRHKRQRLCLKTHPAVTHFGAYSTPAAKSPADTNVVCWGPFDESFPAFGPPGLMRVGYHCCLSAVSAWIILLNITRLEAFHL